MFEQALCQIGDDWMLEENNMKNIEQFFCYVYGYPKMKEINALRLYLFKKRCESSGRIDPKKNVDISSLPACSSSLRQHMKRTNYQVRIWKMPMENYHEIPDPTDHGWTIGLDGLEPLWSEKPILPTNMIDMLDGLEEHEDDEEGGSGYESDFSYSSNDE